MKALCWYGRHDVRAFATARMSGVRRVSSSKSFTGKKREAAPSRGTRTYTAGIADVSS